MFIDVSPGWAAVAFAVIIWWLGTIAVMIVSRRGHLQDHNVKLLAGIAYVGGLVGIAWSQSYDTILTTYLSFSLAVATWGAIEVSYFRGWITGPRKLPCSPNASPFQRFSSGVLTSLHHELVVLLTAAFLMAVGYVSVHATGTTTFVILWLMRWSAKLNLYLGVRNFNHKMLPDAMQYLSSYLGPRRFNALFPISILLAAIGLFFLYSPARLPDALPSTQTAAYLLSTLLLLAVIEHLFLVIPFSDWPLWRWSLKKLSLTNYSIESDVGGPRDVPRTPDSTRV
jgi:putative photosynthetic complex assembly protein 2